MPDARTTRALLLATIAVLALAGSAGIMLSATPPALLHYAASAALFLTALFFASGAYAVWTEQLDVARDLED